VGHFDLSNSLGIPGQFDDPRFTHATETVLRACNKHGKCAGRLTPDVAASIALYKDGFDFVSYSGDVWVYLQAIKSAVVEIREGCASESEHRVQQESSNTGKVTGNTKKAAGSGIRKKARK
jgi:2-dehydro-3-deoxyglucarate aldolase/4-hydroxy-2-oxoheptanedioate aldolase